jgi:hypothetical protein
MTGKDGGWVLSFCRRLSGMRSAKVFADFSTTLSTNTAMLALAGRLGFRCAADPRSATITNLALDIEI